MDRTWEIELERHRLVAVLTHASESDIPVFFLHGIGGSIYFWTPELTSPFHNIGPCYSLSLPGHFPAAFPNDFPADCLTAELIARLVSNAIQEIAGNKKALLVGHSTGGFAALSAAIYDPSIVAGIISIAGFSQGQWTGALGLNQWLVHRGSIGRAAFKTVYRLGRYPALFRMYWQVYASDHISLLKNPCFDRVVNSTFPYLQRLDLDALADYFTVMSHTDITSYLSKITVPTCLIAGDKDPIVPPQQSAMIAENVASARLAIIKGSGHLPFFERPMEYKRVTDSWLTEFQALR